jgi:hypothetical protein
LVEKIGKATNWLNSKEWKTKGLYHSLSINQDLLSSLAENCLGEVYGSLAGDEIKAMKASAV